MAGFSGELDHDSIVAQITSTEFPIALSGGLIGICDGQAIAIIPNVCSGQVQIATVDSTGQLTDYAPFDSAEAYAN